MSETMMTMARITRISPNPMYISSLLFVERVCASESGGALFRHANDFVAGEPTRRR